VSTTGHRHRTHPYTGLPDIDYPLHDKTIVVTRCGRICLGKKKINFSQVFAGQAVGIKEVHDDIWLVSFMDYDLGYSDLETRVLEPLENPFGPKVCYLCLRYVVSPMPPGRTWAWVDLNHQPRPYRLAKALMRKGLLSGSPITRFITKTRPQRWTRV
jgi:hypothetical protein